MSEIISAGPWSGPESRFWSGGTLNGVELPGIVRVRVSRANNWDRKTAKGSHGETQTFNGKKAADIDITIRVWTEDQWNVLATEILPLLEPQAGKETPKPLDIIHPTAVTRNVKALLVDSVAGPDIQDGYGEVQIKAFEYLAPSTNNATGTAQGSPPADPCAAAIADYKVACDKWAAANAIAGSPNATLSDVDAMISAQTDMLNAGATVQTLKCGDSPPSAETYPAASSSGPA
jgi:hypothetical protein